MFQSYWADQLSLNQTFRPYLMKKSLLFSIALIATVLAGCKGEDAVAKCVQANINSDIESGKLKKTDAAAIKQSELMHRASCIENMTPKAY
jgi:PBP1b-binding outer membrane lipoprotein LpoB